MNQNMPSTPRQSNFELLRIVCMLMIVTDHFSVHGGFDFATNTVTIPELWAQFIRQGGQVGVDIFVLITGYFLINATNIKISKVFKLWFQVLFYSAGVYILFTALGLIQFKPEAFFKSLLPITYKTWWFASTYFVLYLTTPFLNKFLKSLDKPTYQKCLVLFLVLWCFIPTIIGEEFESNSLLWFMYVYSVSAYVRLWHNSTGKSCKPYFLTAALFAFLTCLSVLVFDVLGTKIPFFAKYALHFYGMQRLPICIIALCMFLGFKNLDIPYNKGINLISSATFGVYLIHVSRPVRKLMWFSIFKNASYSDTIFLIPYSIAVVLLVYIFCTCVELLRIHLLEKNYMKLINKAEISITNALDKFFSLKIFENL